MSSFRPHLRRFALLAATVALLGAVVAVPINAVDASVTGSLSYDEQITLTPEAVAIVTIVDQTAAADAGVVIGQQRIDAPAAIPIDFSVLFDADTIDPTHSYALFATIVDGTTTWQNAVGEPVITGGPIRAVDLVLTALPSPAAIVGGTILPPAGHGHRAIGRRHRGPHQGRDRDTRRPPDPTDRGSGRSDVLDRV